MSFLPDDEWILGTNTAGSRRYIIHLLSPLFVAEIVEDSDTAGADVGFSYVLAGCLLTDFVFFGEVPPLSELITLLSSLPDTIASG